jgi:hypothetical protein
VLGDINESNILINNRALVTVVDCDSMQVPRDDGSCFRCDVGKADFTPPELQGVDFSSVDRNEEHDRFALAVLLFMILMEGVHPYSGIWLGPGDPPSMEARIKGGDCPYVKNGNVRPMPISANFEILPESVRQLFIDSFLDGHNTPWKRPTALAWHTTLTAVSGALAKCKRNNYHSFSKHLKKCPWCERAGLLGGFDAFSGPQKLPPSVGGSKAQMPLYSPGFGSPWYRLLFRGWPQVASLTLNHAFMGVLVVWLWYPLLSRIFEGMGTSADSASSLSIAMFFGLCFGLACLRVIRTPAPIPNQGPPSVGLRKPAAGPAMPFGVRTVTGFATPKQNPPFTPVVGSRARFVYHRPTCDWVRKISTRNRIQFQSASVAKSAGYRPCHVCSP